MSRGTGLSDAIRAVATEPVLILAALVTLAGDAGTLLTIAVGVYWFGTSPNANTGLDRRRGAFVIACALGAFSLTAGLKALFSLPRPSGSVLAPDAFAGMFFGALWRSFVERAASAAGYGFPSGHAVGSTVVYGALALVASVGTRRRRWIVAGTVIALVSSSRVVLGVHYFVDVLVGCAMGLAYLASVVRIARGFDATRALALAVLVGMGALAVSAATVGLDGSTTRDAVTLLGVSVGAWAVWVFVDDAPSPTTRRDRFGTIVVGIVVAGAPGVLTYVLDPSLPIEFGASVVVGAAMVSAPRIAEIGL